MKYRYREPHEMKESGVEWQNIIPKLWKIDKLKYNYKFEKGKNAALYTQEYIGENNGCYPVYSGQTEQNGIMGYISSYEYDISNCIFTTTVGAKVMTPMLLNGKFSLSQNCLIMKNIKIISNSFIYYQLHPLFNYQKLMIPTHMQPSLRIEDLNKFQIILPKLNEQQKIVNFLDQKCSQFDSVITKKEILITKLEEAKKSLISEVVTGKVKIVEKANGNYVRIKREHHEMKESGIEWLGMIPKEWDIKKIKSFADSIPSNIDKKSVEGEEEILLCNYTDVYYNELITKDMELMKATATKEQIKKFTLRSGDIILTKDSESPDDIAIPAFVPENMEGVVCGYHLIIIRNRNKNLDSKYLFRLLSSTGIANYFATVAQGVTRYGIGIDKFKNLKINIPSYEENLIITKFLDIKCSQFNSIIKRQKQLIEKLKLAKQSLISESVTGKIEIL